MNKTLKHRSILFVALLFVASLGFLSSCTSDPNNLPERTVNRALLTDKQWYLDNIITVGYHYFYSDGKYNSDGGTWKWFESGDSLEITHSSQAVTKLYFGYIEADQMSCGSEFKTNYMTFKTSP